MKKTIFVFFDFIFLFGLCFSQETSDSKRIKFTDFEDQSVYKNVLESITKAVNEQDVEKYSIHFLNFNKNKKRNLAVFFANYNPEAKLIETHIIEKSEVLIELAALYEITFESCTYNIQSIILMKNVDGSWKIAEEKVLSKSKTNRSESNQGCVNNACPVFNLNP